ncbi:MAG: restriction endonuclease subunit S, partial [Leptospiraceae bacterium]|nr:restriction endonuclease subunit S [Leptospiraceae bacterium]
IAIIGDTIGKANRIYQDLAGGFCSNNTARLRIKLKDKVLPEYAEILFQSLPIQKQIEKKKAPTGQPKISDNEIKTIMIPILPYPIQQQIAELVQKSHQARKKAKELLEVAKKAVEIAIEKNEEEALNFISLSQDTDRQF